MLSLAHFSDLHYSGKLLAEADRCFTAAVDAAIALKVDCAVISGDATDHALDVHAPAVAALARNVRRLADYCPVLMLQGTFSHEPPGTLEVFRLLGGRYPVFVADRIQQVALCAGQWLPADAWCFDAVPADACALFSCVPTANKAAVAATVGATAAAAAIGQQLADLLQGFAPANAQARARGMPTIGVAHGTVNGCQTEHGVPMAGLDHEFTTGALFATGASAFLLGHIHQHQSWAQDGRLIAYAGSIGRFHYGEQGTKGFLHWQLEATTATCELIATPARRTVEIAFDGPPDLAELAEIAAQQDLAGAFVRVRWSVPDEDRQQVDRTALQRLLAGAAEVKLEGRVIPVVRTRAAGIARETSVMAKVRAWAAATEAAAEPLLDCLQVLQSQTPEAIAVAVLAAPAAGPALPSAVPAVPPEGPPAAAAAVVAEALERR